MHFIIVKREVNDLLRVLSPAEQLHLTVDAQALIYKYRSHKWLSPRLLEDLITEVVTIARMQQVPADGKLVDIVLHHMGDVIPSEEFLGSDAAEEEQHRALS